MKLNPSNFKGTISLITYEKASPLHAKYKPVKITNTTNEKLILKPISN